jgi:hypothetical protein
LATVTIPFSHGGRRIRMPQLCAVCGDRDCEQVSVTFSARFASGMVGPFVFGRTGTRVLRTTIPVCGRHSGHFATQKMIGCGVALLFLAAIVTFGLGLVGLSVAGSAWGLVAAGVLMALAFGSLILLLVHGIGSVKARSITERELTLTGVHPKFARAVTGDEDEGDGRRRRRDEEEEGVEASASSGAATWLIFGGAAVLLLLLVGTGVGLVIWVNSASRRPADQGAAADGKKRGRDQQPDNRPNPLPIEAGWNENAMQKVFLSDVQEHDAQGYYAFGKNGMHSYDRHGAGRPSQILFNRATPPKGLSLHVTERGYARVKYDLGRQHRLFCGSVALNDLPENPDQRFVGNPVVFAVLGDGRLLWQSQQIKDRGVAESFRLSVAGVQELELRAAHARSYEYGWTIWLDPYLLR